MHVELIHGEFSPKDAIDILTQMVHVKIRFHESKINNQGNQEDTKMRENRIKQLQRELYEARKFIEAQKGGISIKGGIDLIS